MYLGLPICQSILGRESVLSAIMVVTFVLPFYNVLATIVLSYYDPSGRKVSWKRMLKDILTNPMIVAILAALPFSLLGIKLPPVFEKPLAYLGQMSTPMALILIGAGIRPSSFAGRGTWIGFGAIYKVVVTPLVFAVPMQWMGFNPEQIVTAFVMFAVPSAMNVYMVTKKMGGDKQKDNKQTGSMADSHINPGCGHASCLYFHGRQLRNPKNPFPSDTHQMILYLIGCQ